MTALRFHPIKKTSRDPGYCDQGCRTNHDVPINAKFTVHLAGWPAGRVCGKCRLKLQMVWNGAHDVREEAA